MQYAAGMEPLPGYVLVRYLGSGCIGDVWEASGPGGTAAALKFIRLAGASGITEYKAIQRVKRLVHPNLNPITACWLLDPQGAILNPARRHEDVTSDGPAATLVIAMLLGVMSLQTRLGECRRAQMPGIPADELLSYMEDTARGLDFLNQSDHGLGADDPGPIQHGDIKPLNLLLVGNATQICDFGLATALQDHRRSMERSAGTPAYMAPEICRGEAPSRQTDQYSLAITYYELRTGQLPMSDADLTSITRVADAHKKNRLVFDDVAHDEADVLRRATALNANERFESVRDFVRVLRRVVENDQLRETITLPDDVGDADDSASPARDIRSTPRDAVEQTSQGRFFETGSAVEVPIPQELDAPISARETQRHDRPRISDTRRDEEVPAPVHQTQSELHRTLRETSLEPPTPPEAQPWRQTQVTPPQPVAVAQPPAPQTSMLAWAQRVVAVGLVAVALVGWSAALGWIRLPWTSAGVSPEPLEPDVVNTTPEGGAQGDDGFKEGPPATPDPLAESVVAAWKAHDEPIDSIAWISDTQQLATAHRGSLKVWSLEGLTDGPPDMIELDLQDLEPLVLGYNRQSEYLVVGRYGGQVSAWERDSLSGAAHRTVPFPTTGRSAPAVMSVASSKQWLAAGASDGSVALWEWNHSGQGFPQPFHSDSPASSNDIMGLGFVGDHLIGVDGAGAVRCYEAAERLGGVESRVVLSLSRGGVVVSCHERWTLIADEGGVNLWPTPALQAALDQNAARISAPKRRIDAPMILACDLVSVSGADYVAVLTHQRQLRLWSIEDKAFATAIQAEDLAKAAGVSPATPSLALRSLPDGKLAIGLGVGHILIADVSRLLR